MAETRSPRRFFLHKRIQARLFEEGDLEPVWQARQEAEPGTVLASTFPHKSRLAELGYTTTEDLDGADEAELRRAGLTASQAKDVIGAL